MPETLQSRLLYLRNRLRQMTWLYGLSWLVAVVFGATLVAGLLDFSLRIEDAGLRFLFALAIVLSGGWIAWRLLIRPLRRKITDVDIALRIEKRYPGFNDSLASTVQFLQAGSDPRLGSPEMQKRLVEKTVEQVERVSLSDIIETRRVRKVALCAVGICLLAAILAGWNQAAAATALHRLMFPFANRPWPKTTELQLVDESFEPLKFDIAEPLRLAKGDTLDIYVEDLKGTLPEEVRMEYKFGEEDEVISEVLRRTTLRDKQGVAHDVCVASVVATKGPMKFRAVGGDDDEMPWQLLEVVPPPLIENLQISLTPPEYSGQTPETLPEGVGHIRGLVGTKVHLKAKANKPLQSAHLRVKDLPPLRVALSNNGRQLEVDFVIPEPGVYSWWFDLKDLQGFQNANAPRYEVRGTADLVPDVWIDEPGRDRNVTPTAMVPLIVGAKDDLGLKEMRVKYRIGEDPKTPAMTIPLFSGDDRPTQHRVEYEWELAGLQLQPGMVVTFHAEALDDYDLDGQQHVGRSIDRKLVIVAPDEKTAELNFQQGGLIDELDTAHKMQEQTHDQVEQLKIQLQKTGNLRFEDIDLLKRLEIEQRQINSRLSHPQEGLIAHTAELLKELKQNKIDDPDMEQRLKGIATEIAILQEDHLPTIEQELTNTRKMAQTKNGLKPEDNGEEKPNSDKPVSRDERAALERADNNQEAVLDSLGELLAQLSEWRHHRDVTGEVRDLIDTQEAINRDTAEVGRKTFGKRERDLTPQEQADLARLADRQRKQSQRVDELGKNFEDITKQLEKTSPTAAEILTDANAHLRDQAVAGSLQETANQLSRNQIGEATGQQKDALDALNELSDILKNRSVSDTETLVKKLKEARDQIQELRERQEELKKKVDETEQLTQPEEREQQLEKLRQEQEDVRREISSLARRLRRLQAQQPGSSLRRAASRMEQVERLLQEDKGAEAEQEQQEVLDDLEQAERELAEEEQRAEEQLAREMLERIADELKSMIGQQQNVIDETNRLEALRRERGNWSRAQLKSLRDLAEVQRHLQSETERLQEVVKAAEVFALALKGAARDMERAAERLDDRQTDGQTIARETSAKNRFEDLVAALDEEKGNKSEPAEHQGGGGGKSNNGGPQTDGIPHLAQLKMLKTLQEDLIQRTEDLDRIRQDTGSLSEDQKLELDLLAGEQGLLADLTRNLTAQYAEAFQAEEQAPAPQEPEAKKDPEPKPEPTNQKPSLEEELNKDLDLDNLLPEADKPEEPKTQAARLRSEISPATSLGFAYPAQVELKKTPGDEKDETESQPDKSDAPTKETGDKTTEEPKFESKPFKPLKPPKKDDENEKLFRDLVGKDPGTSDPAKNPLEEAIQGMRSARDRIQGQDTGKETREIQEDVVANLQKLIEMAKNNQNKPPSSSSDSPPPQQQQNQDNPQNQPNPEANPKPQNAAQNPQSKGQGEDQEQTQTQTNQQNRDQAEQSTDEERQARNAKANLAAREEMLNEVWGHLPPSVRAKLMNLSSDKYLPKYEDLARRYFESLAEPDRPSSMKNSP